MSRKALINLILASLVIITVIVAITATSYFNNIQKHVSTHETIVLGQDKFVPGSMGAMRLLVRDSTNRNPLEGAEVKVSMRPSSGGKTITLYDGKTDTQGNANVSFSVPRDAVPQQTLIIETKTDLGRDRVEKQIKVQREYRVLLSTDKPIYQPGQVIYLRALALSAFDLIPAASQPLELVIADGKGNKVFRKTVTTSSYGAAAADFQLASEVNTGSYKITASLGTTSSEKTVTVENYVLPKFSIQIKPERSFYLPGQKVHGTLGVNYFFGKPVAGGQVLLEGYTFDVQRNVTVSLKGVTDPNGNFDFDFTLPSYIAGSDLEGGGGRFYLQASITDLAQHTESVNSSLPVAASTLVIKAIPEGGFFRPNVENILYILTSYPDGTPAEASLTVTFLDKNEKVTVKSGAYGLAEVRRTPGSPRQEINIEARDVRGNTASRRFSFTGTAYEETVLLRPEKPFYQVGDAMKLTILTSQPTGSVYLDIVREKQTVSTRSIDVKDGKAEVVIDLTADLFGTLELHAYKILRSGTITRDTRMVVVDNANGLLINLTPGQNTYRPGDQGSLDIQVNGQDGKGVQSALGLAIVDESVFALAEQDPGFAKLYFLLEKELLKPKYDLHGLTVSDLVSGLPEPDPLLKRSVMGAASASLAELAKVSLSQGQAVFSLQANSHLEAVKEANLRQSQYFSGATKGLIAFLIILPIALAVLTGYSLRREKVLGKSVLLGFGILILIVVLVYAWPLGKDSSNQDPFTRLFLVIEKTGMQAGEFSILLAFLGALGFLVLIGITGAKKDLLLGWLLGLLILILAALALLVLFANRSSFSPPGSLVVAVLVALALIPLSFLVRFAGFAWQKQAVGAIATLPLALFLLIGLVPLLASSQLGVLDAGINQAAGQDMLFENRREVFAVPQMLAAPTAPASAGAVKQADSANKGIGGGETATSAAEPPRLRQYFPETMLWIPDAVTDPSGRLKVPVPMADSITTWRMTALASSQDGRLGSTTAPLRVFQDFFIDLDLPLSLTVGDEISVPVGVFNYLTEAQTVRLELSKGDWFELLDQSTKEMKIGVNDISVVYFRIRALNFGRQPFKVTALGSRMSDAIQKEVQVYPNGKQILYSQSDRLTVGTPVKNSVSIPADVIPGTQKLTVKIYPGIVSQLVEGLENILRMPFGCFEQTSSTTYPNVLVLDYLKTTNQTSPEVQMKAEQYINLGYQRLTTFEVKNSGGFSLFGNAPADRMLTAYGLQEFSDMSRVHEVDPALLKRAAQYLYSQQSSDGSWENDKGLVHENTWKSLGNDRLPVTAYIVWSLIDAGFSKDAQTQKGLQYVQEFQSQAKDPYAVALVANALVAADISSAKGAALKLSPATEAVLNRLAELARREGDNTFWQSGVATFMGAEGKTGSIETTALAALALLRADRYGDLANSALTYIIRMKDSFGTWHSTQATVLSLKALLQTLRNGSEKVDATVTVTLNSGQTRTVKITPQNFDVVQLLSFDDINPNAENIIDINVTGKGSLMYQVSGSYYLPWEKLALYPKNAPVQDLVNIDLSYDRKELAVNDTVKVSVKVTLNKSGARAESALIDLGLPPGFDVQGEDLTGLVNRFKDVPKNYEYPTIQRYELTGRQILIYVSNLSNGKPLEFSYRLKAKFPLSVQSPASTAYDYYNPEVSGENKPQKLTVKP